MDLQGDKEGKKKRKNKGGNVDKNKERIGRGESSIEGEEKEGVMKTSIKEGREKWVIVTVYNGGEWGNWRKN